MQNAPILRKAENQNNIYINIDLTPAQSKATYLLRRQKRLEYKNANNGRNTGDVTQSLNQNKSPISSEDAPVATADDNTSTGELATNETSGNNEIFQIGPNSNNNNNAIIVMSSNVCAISKKLNEIEQRANSKRYNIIVLCESWCHPDHLNSEYGINNYTVVSRVDKQSNTGI